jgi:hypothetical protein
MHWSMFAPVTEEQSCIEQRKLIYVAEAPAGSGDDRTIELVTVNPGYAGVFRLT